jgi:predicted RNase H-like HicB family nuclease
VTNYAVIYERAGDGGWNSHAVDLPVYSTGRTREEAEENIREAISLHLDYLRAPGEAPPVSDVEVGAVAV